MTTVPTKADFTDSLQYAHYRYSNARYSDKVMRDVLWTSTEGFHVIETGYNWVMGYLARDWLADTVFLARLGGFVHLKIRLQAVTETCLFGIGNAERRRILCGGEVVPEHWLVRDTHTRVCDSSYGAIWRLSSNLVFLYDCVCNVRIVKISSLVVRLCCSYLASFRVGWRWHEHFKK